MLQRLQNIDRRIIYLVVILTIVLPLMRPVGLPFSITPTTQAVFDYINNLPSGAKIAVAIDYTAAQLPQIHPQARAMLKQIFYDKDYKVAITSIATTGPMFTNLLLKEIEGHDKVYGEDYVHLGYLPGGETAIAAFGKDTHKAYPTDHLGNPIEDLPMMADIHTLSDFDCMVIFTASEPSQYVRIVDGVYNVPMAVGVNSIIVPVISPYIDSGQMFGLMDGMRGAAEYEVLSGYPGSATASMDALSATHVAVIVFLLLGNIAYFASDRGGKKK